MIGICNKMYVKEYIYYITNRFPVQGKFMIGYAKPQLTSDTQISTISQKIAKMVEIECRICRRNIQFAI